MRELLQIQEEYTKTAFQLGEKEFLKIKSIQHLDKEINLLFEHLLELEKEYLQIKAVQDAVEAAKSNVKEV